MRASLRDPTDSAGAGVQVADVRHFAPAFLRDPTDFEGAGVQVADVRRFAPPRGGRVILVLAALTGA